MYISFYFVREFVRECKCKGESFLFYCVDTTNG